MEVKDFPQAKAIGDLIRGPGTKYANILCMIFWVKKENKD